VLAAAERARPHLNRYLGGLLEVERPGAPAFIAASGTAVSQGREALKTLHAEGFDVGLIKIKSVRPFPAAELIAATEKAALLVVPEFNAGGWLAREIKATIDHNSRVVAGPRVFGGMTMPVELIINEVKEAMLAKGLQKTSRGGV